MSRGMGSMHCSWRNDTLECVEYFSILLIWFKTKFFIENPFAKFLQGYKGFHIKGVLDEEKIVAIFYFTQHLIFSCHNTNEEVKM